MERRKLGRPYGTYKDNARRNVLTVRLTDEEMDILEELSERWGKSKAEVVRTLIFAKKSVLDELIDYK